MICVSILQSFIACMTQNFFFSSRRRHTRSYGDWSSDVCSSDLIESELRVTAPGILQEAPADHGLFALAAHAWAKELRESPASIAARASRVKPVAPFAPLHHEGPYVNFTVDPAPFAELALTAVRT